MGAKITKKTVNADTLGSAPFTVEDLGEVKIGLKEVQAKEGGVELKEWQKVWKKACKLEGDFVDGFFKVFDEADNEWVDFREYAIWAALVGRKPVRRKISYCFRVFDKNGNGVLDQEELNLLCEAVYRTIKRIKFNTPGEVNEDGHESFALSSKEEKEARAVAKDLYEYCASDDDDEDGASYKNIQQKWDSDKHLKDAKRVLEWFADISEALPESGKEGGVYSNKYNKSKKGKGKDKSKGKGKKGKSKKGDATSEDEAEAPKGKSKKGKDKAAKGKGKKGKSKKGDTTSEDEAEAPKGKSKKGKDKAAKGKGKKGKSKKGDATSEDEAEAPKGKSKKGKDKSKGKSKKGKSKKADASSEDEAEAPKGKSKKGKDKSKGKSKKGKSKKGDTTSEDEAEAPKGKSKKGKDKSKDKAKGKSKGGKSKGKGKK